MKKFKRIQTLLLALVMCFSCVSGTTAFAADIPENVNPAENASSPIVLTDGNIVDVKHNEDGTEEVTYEFEITPDSNNSGEVVLMSSNDIDQTFTMTSSHQGASRRYYQDTISYSIEVRDANGNLTESILAVRLYEHATGRLVQENQFSANHLSASVYNIPINYGYIYYFKYLVAYGEQTLKVHMKISIA